MTLQNVRTIKGAVDKNGLKDVMCEQGFTWSNCLDFSINQASHSKNGLQLIRFDASVDTDTRKSIIDAYCKRIFKVHLY